MCHKSIHTRTLTCTMSAAHLHCDTDGQQAAPQQLICCHHLRHAVEEGLMCSCCCKVSIQLPLGSPGVIHLWRWGGV